MLEKEKGGRGEKEKRAMRRENDIFILYFLRFDECIVFTIFIFFLTKITS
jgi:hypothetical protein